MTTTHQISQSETACNANSTPLDYAGGTATQHTLYSPQAVAIATFLGAPLADAAILALNYIRLGRKNLAVAALLCGILATIVLIGVGQAISLQAVGMFSVVPILIMRKIAESLQGQSLAEHKAQGGRIGSCWNAAGIGLLSLASIFAIAFALVYASINGTRLAVGSAEVLYSGSATAADAQSLGNALTDDGYFITGKPMSVLLSKDASGTTLKFVVNDAAGQQASTLDEFSKIVDQIAPSLGGKPITLKLVNPELTELQSKKVE